MEFCFSIGFWLCLQRDERDDKDEKNEKYQAHIDMNKSNELEVALICCICFCDNSGFFFFF